MGLNVLIVEPREITRMGLRAILNEDPLVEEVSEAIDPGKIETHLRTNRVDLTIIHQSLIKEMKIFPRGSFVILTTHPDKNVLVAACNQGARGYLLEHASSDLIRLVLRQSSGFILDPHLTLWALEYFWTGTLPIDNSNVLTSRELEVFHRLRDGLSNRAIADQLCIAESTVKTHVAHIFRKLDMKRRPVKSLDAVFSSKYA